MYKQPLPVLCFPSFKSKYEMLVASVAWLVPQAKLSANMHFVTGSVNDAGYVQSVEMKIISETEPGQRLKKLIQKGLFAEAEVTVILLLFVTDSLFLNVILCFRHLPNNQTWIYSRYMKPKLREL